MRRRWTWTNSRYAVLALGMLSLAIGQPQLALAHDGLPPAPHDLWQAWSLEPALLLGLALSALAYARGLGALWGRAGIGRGVRVWQALAFASGMLTLLVSLVSPLDPLGGALFAAHMVQHMLLVLIAAPLLVLGRPIAVMPWAVAAQLRRWPIVRSGVSTLLRILRGASQLPVAVALHVVTLWVWHTPLLYETALRSEPVHVVEHASFLGTALLTWWAVLHPRQGQALASALALFALTIQGGLLGALLTFAPKPWYPAYTGLTAVWGLTPLEDQQIAGVIMWLPGGTVYLVAALAMLGAWLLRAEHTAGVNTSSELQTLPRASADM